MIEYNLLFIKINIYIIDLLFQLVLQDFVECEHLFINILI